MCAVPIFNFNEWQSNGISPAIEPTENKFQGGKVSKIKTVFALISITLVTFVLSGCNIASASYARPTAEFKPNPTISAALQQKSVQADPAKRKEAPLPTSVARSPEIPISHAPVVQWTYWNKPVDVHADLGIAQQIKLDMLDEDAESIEYKIAMLTLDAIIVVGDERIYIDKGMSMAMHLSASPTWFYATGQAEKFKLDWDSENNCTDLFLNGPYLKVVKYKNKSCQPK